MNYTLLHIFSNELFITHEAPCISIYMPTHPSTFDHKKDILVYKNLVKEAILSLELRYKDKDISSLISNLNALEDDAHLWDNVELGLVLFLDMQKMNIFLLKKAVEPLSIVSNSFHIKPLFAYYQNIETFTILDLGADSFTLYESDLYSLEKMDISPEVKTTLSDVLGKQHTDSYQTHGVYGGANNSSTFHGHGGKSDDIEIDRIKFFRYVDKTVLEEVSKISKHPLILLANKEHHHDFKNISNNPYLLDESIDGSLENIPQEELKNHIKEINDQRFNIITAQMIERYHTLLHHDLSSDQLIIILKALLESRVEILMIENNKIIPGKIDYEKNQIMESELENPETDDLLDDMIEHAMKTGTKIYLFNQEKMPTTSGIAAIFRY